MNKIITKVALSIALSLGSISTAWSYVIDDTNAGSQNGTDIGSVDTLIDQADKASGFQAEVDWVNLTLGTNLEGNEELKFEEVTYFSTDASDIFTFELESGPGYYLIKNAGRMALFENLNDFSWAVIDASLLVDGDGDHNGNERDEKWNIPSDELQISHITEFGNAPTDVPEPGTLALLGLGLLSLTVSRKRLSA